VSSTSSSKRSTCFLSTFWPGRRIRTKAETVAKGGLSAHRMSIVGRSASAKLRRKGHHAPRSRRLRSLLTVRGVCGQIAEGQTCRRR
jgi:hypothetical protein